MQIVAETGLSWHAVNKAITLYKAGDAELLMPKARGKKAGAGRVLTPEQERELCDLLTTKRPENKPVLWHRDAVSQLIEQHCDLRLSIRAVGNYLNRWGFVLKYPNKRPYNRCSKEIRNWLDTHYDSLEHDAKQHNAQIYWFSKKNITLPLLETEASESNKFLMNTAVSNQGKIHWNIEQGIFTAERQIKFLRAFVKLSKHPIILIKDDKKVFSNNLVLEWVAKKGGKIKIYPDPTT